MDIYNFNQHFFFFYFITHISENSEHGIINSLSLGSIAWFSCCWWLVSCWTPACYHGVQVKRKVLTRHFCQAHCSHKHDAFPNPVGSWHLAQKRENKGYFNTKDLTVRTNVKTKAGVISPQADITYGNENELHSEPDRYYSVECVTVLEHKLHHKEEITGNVQRPHVTRPELLLTDKRPQVNKWLGPDTEWTHFGGKSNPCRSA